MYIYIYKYIYIPFPAGLFLPSGFLEYTLNAPVLLFILANNSSLVPLGSFHTNNQASPMFLLAAPPYKCTHPCTINAILLTNTMMSSCKHSVATTKYLISQNPKIAIVFLPGIIGFSAPPLPKYI